MIDLKPLEVWFVTGSQHLYGPETLEHVAEHSQGIAQTLGGSAAIPVNIVFKTVLTTPEDIHQLAVDRLTLKFMQRQTSLAAYRHKEIIWIQWSIQSIQYRPKNVKREFDRYLIAGARWMGYTTDVLTLQKLICPICPIPQSPIPKSSRSG